MSNNERDLLTRPSVRERHLHRTEVLNKVGELKSLPNSKYSTTKQIIEFYGTSSNTISGLRFHYKNDFNKVVIKQASHSELRAKLIHLADNTKDWIAMRTELGISTTTTNLYSKQAVLLIGFLLDDSEVAKKVRELVMQGEMIEEIGYAPAVVEKVEQEETKSNTELQVVNHDGQFVIDSRDVAEMVGKEHKNLMRDIKGYIEVISESSTLSSQDFFIPSTYKVVGNNKTYECYLLTKKGCDMVANKMIGAKGILFTATYVTKFEEMENQLKSQVQAPIASYMINDPIERAKQWIVEQQQTMLLAEKVQEQTQVIEQKEQVIAQKQDELNELNELIKRLTDGVPVATQRQELNKLIRKGCGNHYQIGKRWNLLYDDFNTAYRCNVRTLCNNFNTKRNIKLSIVEYIERELCMLTELYTIAIRIFKYETEQITREREELLTLSQ